ncbi:CGNR zinc finger domain-containing protein [Lacisediminihabitans changchengi]|uniref:CGNR zinc finger domain-containing protein n=1 Tax=Lacisediminihabitans changchengi TaxID=2787634 RepID=A0A934W2F3_9MICO|nr:CGNR zinc finger domain-containing protein [Lacisediminihabitans changchengi]MBK4346129.1 CGNR zinc finger domain-containing protein [Lacisediminihabitans changchengi]
MQLAPDTEEVLAFTVTLANTDPTASRSGEDELATIAQLRDLLALARYSGRIDHDEPERRDVLATRDRLRAIWSLDRDDAVDEVNAMLREAKALPQLTRHDGSDWHWHATAPDAPLAERIRVEVALALADVIRMDATDRLRVCAAPDCSGLLVDLSRNGSKRFCSVRCGNRVNMIAFRERASGTQARALLN